MTHRSALYENQVALAYAQAQVIAIGKWIKHPERESIRECLSRTELPTLSRRLRFIVDNDLYPVTYAAHLYESAREAFLPFIKAYQTILDTEEDLRDHLATFAERFDDTTHNDSKKETFCLQQYERSQEQQFDSTDDEELSMKCDSVRLQ